MQMQQAEFLIDTKPTKDVAISSITRDISIDACLLDLIDNAVDAAREAIFLRKDINDDFPYAGYNIELLFSNDKISITDNCGGITKEQLMTKVLRFGERSSHRMGIGIFGLGLNRALFKLGNICRINTDTGVEHSEFSINIDEYKKAENWDIPAHTLDFRGEIGTKIEITQLFDEVSRLVQDQDWLDRYVVSIGRIYARFIQKGLCIKINDKFAQDGEIRIRRDGPFSENYKTYSSNGVSVYISSGQHINHRFTAEPDYDQSINANLTDQYGWTVFCNDRAVILSDKSHKTGWDRQFHSEFYGFVGTISFNADDPASLPWDTTKLNVDLNNAVYQVAQREMQKFSESWRVVARKAKEIKKKGGEISSPPSPSSSKEELSTPENEKQKDHHGDGAKRKKADTNKREAGREKGFTVKKDIKTKKDHNNFREILPSDINEDKINDKLLALVHEAKNFDVCKFPYSGMALMRILFELSMLEYAKRHNKFDDMKKFVVDTRASAKNGKAVETEKIIPNLEEMLKFATKNDGILSGANIKGEHLRRSIANMSRRKMLLNGVMHNPYQTINQMEALSIRDEILAVVRHFIEY